MPRQNRIKRRYELKKKNSFSLLDDSNIDSHLKSVKVGDKNSILELSDKELKIRGTIDADAITVKGISVQTGDEVGAITALNSATENEVVTVGATTTELDAEANLTFDGTDLSIAATGKINFDGGGDTYITESSADVLKFYVGGDVFLTMTEYHTSGNVINMSGASCGFTQIEPTFDATDTEVKFIFSNKQKLTLTDNCTDIHFRFPNASGNFVCVLLQDGTGGRTISNWKTKDLAGNAGAGNSGLVLWAGGAAPSNTETADKADIVSFYWDNDNEIAYGTYTYNF